jgi:dTDP-glucose 4,6-dehydratase
MRLMITGGAGFIGSTLVRLALRQGHEVTVLDKVTYAASDRTLADLSEHGAFRFERADITDAPAVERCIFRHRPDAIFHLAAETHVDRSIETPRRFLDTNVAGTVTLLDSALRYWEDCNRPRDFRFIHVSTDEVFGTLGPDGCFTEESPYSPRSPYAASKAAADHFARAWGVTYGLPVIVTNCSNNYGPFQHPEKLIPRMIVGALLGQPLPIYGDGQQRRDWLFVEDHADALMRVLARGAPGRTYAIGGGYECPNLDLVTLLCERLDERYPEAAPHARLIRHVADRRGHDRRYAIDGTRIRTELGWVPRTGISEGIARTIDWYLGNVDWWRPLALREPADLPQRGAA